MSRLLFTQLAGVLVSIPMYGGVITTQTFNFGTKATVTVTVLDNYHGDPSKQDWIYTIDNLSFTTMPAANAPMVGLSAFGTGALSGMFARLAVEHLSDVTGVFEYGNNPLLMGDVSPGFCYQCDLYGGGWILPPYIFGVRPGQSATVDFSWLNIPGTVTTAVTTDAYLGTYTPYFISVEYFLGGSVLVPRTTVAPEPATSGVAAFALCMFGSLRWYRQRFLRTRARRTL